MKTIGEKLMRTVQELERLEEAKRAASDALREGFEVAKSAGFDSGTLKVVLRLRKMSPEERKEKRALEAIYMAALGMLEGDPLTDEARRRLDGQDQQGPSRAPSSTPSPESAAPKPPEPVQQPLVLKDPEEARQEGRDAAAAGKRVYDNPFSAGDPCRAAWDEGWCEQKKSHGMDLPDAYKRRTTKPPDDKDKGAEGGEKDAA